MSDKTIIMKNHTKISLGVLFFIIFVNGCVTKQDQRLIDDSNFMAACMLIHPIASKKTIRRCADNLHLRKGKFGKMEADNMFLKRIKKPCRDSSECRDDKNVR